MKRVHGPKEETESQPQEQPVEQTEEKPVKKIRNRQLFHVKVCHMFEHDGEQTFCSVKAP